jgi:dephospho-CoA kinase
MIKVGLTGGYATGKTFVAAQLADLGCRVIHADQLGHRTLEPDGDAYRPVVDLFGSSISGPDGRIDRRKLAAIVFRDEASLQKLNAIVHPAVYRLESAILAQWHQEQPDTIAIVEAAILIETGRYQSFDRLVVTFCDESKQIERAMERDQISREDVLARLSRQLPLSEKKKHADYLINTGASKEDTKRQVLTIYEDLKSLTGNHT